MVVVHGWVNPVVWLALTVLPAMALAQEDPSAQTVAIGVLRQLPEEPPWSTNLTRAPEDEGFAGARLASRDNETTGRITKQAFKLVEESLVPGDDPLPAFERLAAGGLRILVLDLAAEALLRIAEAAKGRDLLLFNAGSSDDRLRGADCRDNLLHIAPSRAMLTDALAQYLVAKRWRRWFLITGRTERDRLYAEALRRAARKFGARIVAEKAWEFGPDARRTAQAEVPVFTQGAEHDVVIVADEPGEFGDLISYRTWEPRPVAGTQGLVPTAWHAAQEQWGAAQFQNRFQRIAARPMRALDYTMWAAVRAVGEAATRTRSTDLEAIRTYLRSPAFELAAFKGAPLTFRDWDWQLRQPIPLAHPTSFVSMSPQAGFLHQRTPLDTLGIDKAESACSLAARGPA
jgi:ABC transporter substrate binding protein (PQQ-dependent alcohol dehydrogenase system)